MKGKGGTAFPPGELSAFTIAAGLEILVLRTRKCRQTFLTSGTYERAQSLNSLIPSPVIPDFFMRESQRERESETSK